MGDGTVLTDSMNESGNVGNEDEAEPGGGDVGLGLCGDKDWADNGVVVHFGCPPESYAVEGAVNVVLSRNDINELNEGELGEHVVWRDG